MRRVSKTFKTCADKAGRAARLFDCGDAIASEHDATRSLGYRSPQNAMLLRRFCGNRKKSCRPMRSN